MSHITIESLKIEKTITGIANLESRKLYFCNIDNKSYLIITGRYAPVKVNTTNGDTFWKYVNLLSLSDVEGGFLIPHRDDWEKAEFTECPKETKVTIQSRED